MQTATTEDAKTYADEMMKRFKLVDMREQYSDIIAEAEANSIGYMDFLLRLLSVEEEGKNARRQEMLLEKANFDSISSLKDIDYSFNHALDREKIEELGKLHFLIFVKIHSRDDALKGTPAQELLIHYCDVSSGDFSGGVFSYIVQDFQCIGSVGVISIAKR